MPNAPDLSIDVLTSLRAFLVSPAAAGCSRVVVVPSSTNSAATFQTRFSDGVAALPAGDPDVAAVTAIGPRIVLDSGHADRARLGAIRLTRGMWLVPVGSTLFIFTTAGLPGQRTRVLPGVLTEVLARLTPTEVHLPSISKVVRTTPALTELLTSLATDVGGRVFIHGTEADLGPDLEACLWTEVHLSAAHDHFVGNSRRRTRTAGK